MDRHKASHREKQRRHRPSINDLGNYGEMSWYDQRKLYRIIFLNDTKEGWRFDVIILSLVLLSVIAVFIHTITDTGSTLHYGLLIFEWVCTILFTVEYIFRIYASFEKKRYIFSFFGLIDLFSVLPSYLSIAFVGAHYMLILRIVRLLRVFKILQMGTFVEQGKFFSRAIKHSYEKISVFMLWIAVLVSLLGTVMYLIEGPVNPNYSSIPRSIYWAMITLTTVGYGDITPITPLGQFVSTIVMLLGYSIIAVPTGIISAEVAKENSYSKVNKQLSTLEPHEGVFCHSCGHESHQPEDNYCSICGTKLIKPE
ncbi:ion transporter [Porphyromonas sp.]|uniref:ion transporter n=1 Tax=Porphyromonas sp. TaxID=1924944 RepID=UPI0026DBC2F2|nr:ion transporter [Porphyromonas sp.]MDO4695503.1 ion transporter [Porphyromonas sp.]MDO4770256.1 ion transporter [Porphyromonas sp.]